MRSFLFALSCATAVSACAVPGASTWDEDPIALGNALADDSVGVELRLKPGEGRYLAFDCAQRCDVTLNVSLDGLESERGAAAPLGYLTLARADGFSRMEDLGRGARTLAYSQLPAGRHVLMLGTLSSLPIDVRVRASWIEAPTLAGGSAALLMTGEPSDSLRGTLSFACEEPAGCDLLLWTKLRAVDYAGRSERALPLHNVSARIIDSQGFDQHISSDAGPDHVIATNDFHGLVQGEYRIEHDSYAPYQPAPSENEYLSLSMTAEWFPARPLSSPESRLVAFLRARQTAIGCDDVEPSSAATVTAQSTIGERAPRDESLTGVEQMGSGVAATYVLPAPIVSEVIETLARDHDLTSRIDRCDRYGVGLATTPSRKTYVMVVLTPRD